MSDEKTRLENIACNSRYAEGVNPLTILYSAYIFERHFRTGSILELGPAEGVMTEHLLKGGRSVTVVEGSERFCTSLRERYPSLTVINKLFEDFVPDKAFDNIVLGHVLEHVDDPVKILSLVRGWLAPRGRILAAVPNARSLHRQAAVIMGMLKREDELNDLDKHHGHRRVYTPEIFRADFIAAGLSIEIFGGYWIKPVSNKQIESTWTPEMINAFMALGERYPDIAAEIYVIASK